jgi:hypothetical protein
LSFLACQAGALLLNYATFDEWLRYWWIRLPQHSLLSDSAGPGATATGAVAWQRLTFLFVLATGVGGALRRWLFMQNCPTVWSALAAGLAFVLAAIGSTRNAFLPVSTFTLATLGLWLAVVPAAHSLSRATTWLVTAPGRRHVGVVIGGSLFLLVGGVVARRPAADEWPPWWPRPLALGLPLEATALERALNDVTTSEARILWEDLPGQRDCGWSVLVSTRLGRSCIGGLDPEGIIEHSTIGLRNGSLRGRPLAAWTDEDLAEYCRRYNVGWVVCSSPAARQRFTQWPLAATVPVPPPAEGWHVFALRRPHSFVLKGAARTFDADARRVTLVDVVPEKGGVLLSLHYQAGWRVRPAWVQVDSVQDAYDPIQLIRLQLPGPVGRVTLTWEGP